MSSSDGLASLAGRAIVSVAAADGRETARLDFARLLGRGDAERTRRFEERQKDTRKELADAVGPDVEEIFAKLSVQWATRLGDMLEEDPSTEAALRALVQSVESDLPSVALFSADQLVSARRDMAIRATGSAIAAGVVKGPVTTIGRLDIHQQTISGQPVRLAPHPNLVGRTALLAELDSRLARRDRPGPRLVVLCGLAGAGKTSLAVEYAHQHLLSGGVAWQLEADNPAVLAARFNELAAQLGAVNPFDPRNPVVSAHAVLATYPTGWLIIFDNASDWESIEPYLPPAGRGQILITSQSALWPPGQSLDVPVLSPEVAADFLVQRSGDLDRQAAADLALELGGLPLALEQAAAYVHATGDTLADYLRSFRQRRPEMLRRGEAARHKTVATTWKLAFDWLENHAPEAAGLLRLLACCAPEAVPLHLLLQARPGLTEKMSKEIAATLKPLQDELSRKDAILALRRYSLINLVTGIDRAGGTLRKVPASGELALDRGVVSVHRLVQAVMIDEMPPELAKAWREASAAVIVAALPMSPEQPNTWPVFAALLPHAQTAVRADSEGMARIADYLGHSGSYVAARELCQRVLEAQIPVLGSEDPAALQTRANLASWTGEAGDPAGARAQYAALVPVIEDVLGADHQATLRARANLARWTGAAGDPHKARGQYTTLLPVIMLVLGPEHPDTLRARANLAYLTGEAGDPPGARDQYARLVPVLEGMLGAYHPDTLAARANLAYMTGKAGDPPGARDQYAALVPVIEAVLGAEHQATLRARANHARCIGDAGDPARARDLYKELLLIHERVRGSEHPDTVAILLDIAYWAREGETGRLPNGGR